MFANIINFYTKLKLMKKILFYALGLLLPIAVCLAVYSNEKPNEDPTVMANIEALTDAADSPWPNQKYIVYKGTKRCSYTVYGITYYGFLADCAPAIYGSDCMLGCLKD